MVREIDTRNFSYNRADETRTRELSSFASSVSEQLPGDHTVSVSYINSLTGTPNVLRSSNAQSISGSRLELIEQALEHVQQTSRALGFAPSEPVEFVPDPTVEQTSAESYAVHLQQDYRGIPVFQMTRTVRFSPNREITEVVGNNVNLPPGIDIAPQIDVVQAVRAAVQYVTSSNDSDQRTDGWGQSLPAVSVDVSGYEPRVLVSFSMPSRPTVLDKGPFEDLIPAHLVIFYQNPDARLGWHMVIAMPEYQGQYEVIVSADRQQPEILYCQNTVHTVARGNVYLENPRQTPKQQISFPRALGDYPVPIPNQLPLGFPGEWCDDDSCIGNNTIATLGNSPTTFRGRKPENENVVVFDPGTPDEQKILNIFYFCNYMHDFFYMLGFDETAGNFQQKNSSGDGLPGDPVLARAHSGRVFGTANMLTPVDGQSPIMNMGLVEGDRHTAFDADVVFHEFVHGVTNRLVGGRMNDSALRQPQSRGMGEGWSDYFALTIQNYGKPNEKVVTGDWVVNNPQGIRMHPYDSNYPGNFGSLGRREYREEHNIGEIWCATLMQMNRNIGEALGDRNRGHQIGWQIVVDGLKLTSANPSFLDARDAILRALDDLLAAGKLSQSDRAKVRKAAWQAFSKFGMGPNADCFGASLQGIVADFELPNDL
jgi:extracellular elastinolytic metalloproteinase